MLRSPRLQPALEEYEQNIRRVTYQVVLQCNEDALQRINTSGLAYALPVSATTALVTASRTRSICNIHPVTND
jgi:hypothetical protein